MDPLKFFAKNSDKQKEKDKKLRVGGGQWTSESAGALRFCGWSTEGMMRFNELCEKVKVNRDAYPQFDENYLKARKQQHKLEQCNIARTKTINKNGEQES